jgi:hypothetical protein
MPHIAIKAYSFDPGEQEAIWNLQSCLLDFYHHVADVQLFYVLEHVEPETSARCAEVN